MSEEAHLTCAERAMVTYYEQCSRNLFDSVCFRCPHRTVHLETFLDIDLQLDITFIKTMGAHLTGGGVRAWHALRWENDAQKNQMRFVPGSHQDENSYANEIQ